VECFPPCAVCTGLCKSPVQTVPVSKPRKHWKPNDKLVRLKCGCAVIPWPIVHYLGEFIDKGLCDLHGWQPLAKERKQKKVKPVDPNQAVLDIPPF
jgi:hypothetical protein